MKQFFIISLCAVAFCLHASTDARTMARTSAPATKAPAMRETPAFEKAEAQQAANAAAFQSSIDQDIDSSSLQNVNKDEKDKKSKGKRKVIKKRRM